MTTFIMVALFGTSLIGFGLWLQQRAQNRYQLDKDILFLKFLILLQKSLASYEEEIIDSVKESRRKISGTEASNLVDVDLKSIETVVEQMRETEKFLGRTTNLLEIYIRERLPEQKTVPPLPWVGS